MPTIVRASSSPRWPRWPMLIASALVLAIWALAYVRLFIDPTPRIPVLVNWTPSLPYRLAVWQRIDAPLTRGAMIVYAFEGDARRDHPGLHRQPFFKIVRGLPGDRVTVDGRAVSINGEVVGQAKTHTSDRRPLEPIVATVIPPGHYYVQGTADDSFDSRYRSSGLVRAEQVLGRVVPLF